MADGTKVADLYASLGMVPDKKEWDRAKRELVRYKERMEREETRSSARRATRQAHDERRAWRTKMDLFQHDLRMQAGRQKVQRLQDQIDEKRGPRGLRAKMGKNVGSYSNLTRGLVPFGMNPAALAGMVGTGAGIAAGRDALRFDEQLTGLDIASKGAMGSLDGVRSKVLAVSKATGVAKEEILGGASSFVALTGDGDAASKAMETFARVQKATGAQTSEIAATAAALTQQLGIMPQDLEKVFSILHRGGKEGAVEFSEMASLMASLSAGFKQFGGSQGKGGVAALNAMFQTARQGFGSSSQAATGMEQFMNNLASPKTLKAMKKFGVEVFEIGKDGKPQFRDLLAILDDMAKTELAYDARARNAAFESSEARRTVQVLLEQKDAVRRIATETLGANDISEDFMKKQASASAQVAKAWNDIKVGVAEAFTTERLQAFAMMLTDVMDMASRLPGFFEDIVSIDSPTDRADAAAELDKRLLAGESLQQIADSPTGAMDFQGQNVARMAKYRLLGENTDATSARAKAVLAEADKMGVGSKAGEYNPYRAGEENTLRGITARATAAYQPISPTFNLTVNAPPGADGKQMAEVIQRELGSFWDGKMREVGGS